MRETAILEEYSSSTVALDARRLKCFSWAREDMVSCFSNLARTHFDRNKICCSPFRSPFRMRGVALNLHRGVRKRLMIVTDVQ